MSLEVSPKSEFNVAGLSVVGQPGSPEFSVLWDRLFSSGLYAKLMALGTSRLLGACYDMQPDGSLHYMAGVEVVNVETAKQYKATVLHVPAADYYIHPCKGPVPNCIFEGWKQAMEILAQEGYRHSGAPDFEHYVEGDLNSPDYAMEIWIPVQKIA